MNKNYSFHSIIEKNEDGIYTIYFPILRTGGFGYKDLKTTEDFACELLEEILLDLDAERINELQKEDIEVYGGQSNYSLIKADSASYVKRIRKDEKRSYDDIQDEVTKAVTAAPDQSTPSVKETQHKHVENQFTTGKRKIYIVAGVLIACLIVGIAVMNGMKARKWEKEIQETIQESRDHISLQEYEEGYKVLSDLKENPETGDYSTEIESLYDYALLKDNRDEDGGSLSIEEQYQYSQDMAFDTDDELYKDATDLVDEIKREYEEEQQRIAEEEAKQAALAEAKEAKERKDYLEKLATTVPFEGMESKYVDCTMCGAHDYEENRLSGWSSVDYDFLYYWRTENENWLRVYVKEDEIVDVEELVQQHRYWDEDGFPQVEELKKVRRQKIDEYGSERDSEVDSYWTGKEYADKHADKYMEKLKGKTEYSVLKEDELKALGSKHMIIG